VTLKPGARLGPFEIVSWLGAGGMGEVFRARDRRLGREVAVKVLPPSADRDRLERFELEARATSALNHPNIVALYDVGTNEGRPYVVTELLEGETLRERMGGAALPVRKVLEYAGQIAQGLGAAHQKGIVHRDLKPENIFVTDDGRIKILDFGLAKLRDPDASKTTSETDTVGRIEGTAGYMSPEQIRGEAADVRSDIFSFGAILYEMIVGRRAFQGATAVETMNAILKEDPPPVTLDRTPACAGLERLLWHCLEKAPQERFQSARDLAFDLESLGDSFASDTSGPPHPVHAGASRRLLLLLGLASGLLSGMALHATLFQGAHTTVPSLRRLTFRRGSIESGRFAPDGNTIIYGASWEGGPLELFSTRREGPDYRSLGFASTDLLSVSSSGDMAVSLGRRRIGTFVGVGILARAPLAGGAPREMETDIQQADWAPDGRSAAVVRTVAGRNRLEYPLGNVLYETAGWISHPRFARNGQVIAFLDHPVWGDDGGNVAQVDPGGRHRLLSRNWDSLQGLAWSADGREVWFTGARQGSARALHAVTPEGKERTIYRMAGALTLHDIIERGDVLLSHQVTRREMLARAAGEEKERDLTWLDYSFPSSVTPDGSAVFFAENGEGGGDGYSAYLRKTDASPAVRLGEGAALALSPDGKWALVNTHSTSENQQLTLLPTGIGEPRSLPRSGIQVQAATWLPDGSHVLVAGNERGRPVRCYSLDVQTGESKPITPEGTRFVLSSQPVAPDGRAVILREAGGQQALYPLAPGTSPTPIGLEPEDQPIRWSSDGHSLFVYRPGAIPAQVYQLDVRTGKRELWKELMPPDGAGVLAIGPILLTPDGRSYVYGYRRVLADLYLVEGLR